jgi:uncharacterized membrane protein
MRDDEHGMDRTVAATWAPDDTWPAFTDDVIDEPTPATGDAVSGADGTETRGGDTGSVAPAAAIEAFAAFDDDDDEAAETDGVEAVAAIEGHPLHPAIVPLPIGSFVGAFVCDLAYARTGDRFWARGARLLTGAGLVTGLVAGALGAMDFTGRASIRTRPAAGVHAAGNLSVLGLAAVSEALRARDERAGTPGAALAISAASVAVLGVTGWLGGELAFRDRIGMTSR